MSNPRDATISEHPPWDRGLYPGYVNLSELERLGKPCVIKRHELTIVRDTNNSNLNTETRQLFLFLTLKRRGQFL